MAEDRDLALFLKMQEMTESQQRIEQSQQRLETDVQSLVPLLEQIISHLEVQKQPPTLPLATWDQLYPSAEDLLSDDEVSAAVPDPVQALPPHQGPWRRMFAARSTRVLTVVGLLICGTLPWWCVNLTASAPRGLWLRSAVPPVVERGMWVTLSPPASITPWYTSWAPLLKPVAAVAGTRVCVKDETLWIHGQSYGRVYDEAEGQALPHLREGCVAVGAGQVFLASPAPKSIDSRYFGAVPVGMLTARATPLLTWRD